MRKSAPQPPNQCWPLTKALLDSVTETLHQAFRPTLVTLRFDAATRLFSAADEALADGRPWRSWRLRRAAVKALREAHTMAADINARNESDNPTIDGGTP